MCSPTTIWAIHLAQNTSAVPCSLGVDNQPRRLNTVGIIPCLNSLMQNPTISQAVIQVISGYDAQARQDAGLGKHHSNRKSRRFNTTDTIIASPELRWPNEGHHGINGKKQTMYDELSLPEWAVGQLTNICHIQDQVTSKKALPETIMALKNATSLP